MPSTEAAAPRVIRRYLAAHGPATPAAFSAWLARGLGAGMVKRWFDAMQDELAAVDVAGRPMQLLRSDVGSLHAQQPSDVVCLLGGFDQYLLGAGTDAEQIVPKEHRTKVSRTAGWISPVVVRGGRVVGTWTWEAAGGEVALSLWETLPRALSEPAVARIRSLLRAV
ncbi:MAG: winged helix DNA-binding domain-containing protein [Candidatus Dormibacteraeota bacterium]|uniref:Winged helix DNA-binding domain-containing protein n=1 Tax=Candidatus Amunia macphersoniae TaxID=3127014 RepID=A0A934NFX1_9BACT|nr:winged helix DNA-binding domain-containing protein [Candidatus Dormibacteraeota bacterium]